MIALAQQSNILDEVIHGEALAVLRTLPDNSVDAIVCDPPAGISFMGKDWDNYSGKALPNREQEKRDDEAAGKWMQGRGTLPYGFGATTPTVKERDAFISFIREVMAEALRALKPGGHAFVWALPRTSHWTGIALEDAGFEIRDVVTHLFGSGFPKSADISKAIDRMQGAERKKIKSPITAHTTAGKGFSNELDERPWMNKARELGYHEHAGNIPATPEASQWNGWGTALKPSSEHWWLCRKPLSEPTIAANVLKWGTGAINIDVSRIGHDEPFKTTERSAPRYSGVTMNNGVRGGIQSTIASAAPQGRWPANLLLSHSVWCVPNVEDWLCDESCPIRLLDEQSGNRSMGHIPRTAKNGGIWGNGKHPVLSDESNNAYNDQGGASRYFMRFSPFIYQAKASRAERNSGCEGLPEGRVARMGHGHNEPDERTQSFISQPQGNTHPTVKPIQLMRYLVRMITPPGGIVLDCFAGSGSTLVAAIHEGMHFIGIEMNDSEQEPYVSIARARIEQAFREVQS